MAALRLDPTPAVTGPVAHHSGGHDSPSPRLLAALLLRWPTRSSTPSCWIWSQAASPGSGCTGRAAPVGGGPTRTWCGRTAPRLRSPPSAGRRALPATPSGVRRRPVRHALLQEQAFIGSGVPRSGRGRRSAPMVPGELLAVELDRDRAKAQREDVRAFARPRPTSAHAPSWRGALVQLGRACRARQLLGLPGGETLLAPSFQYMPTYGGRPALRPAFSLRVLGGLRQGTSRTAARASAARRCCSRPLRPRRGTPRTGHRSAS